eukprot:4465317-Amphidinium_carterae.3
MTAITGGGFFKKINMMSGNKQDWHLSRDESVKMEVMGFLENISDLLHHFSFDEAAGQKFRDMTFNSPTVAKARKRCKDMDKVRERNRVKKEEDLRKEQEAKERSSKEMKANEDELREVIRKDKDIRDAAEKSAREFMNDNADNGTLYKHCETKITRAIGDKNATLYARYTYIIALAAGQNLEKIFDAVDQGASSDEGQQQGGLTGKTTPEGAERTYSSKYIKKYPPEQILTQQIIEVLGNGSANQYMGQFPDGKMTAWMRRFAEA